MRKVKSKKYATVFVGVTLSFLFAFVALAVNTLETWMPSWEVHAGDPAPVTLRLPSRYFRITMERNEYHYLSTDSSVCSHLIPRGRVLEKGRECTGVALAYESARQDISPFRLLGILIFYLVVGILFTTFMRSQGMQRARTFRAQCTIFALMAVFLIGAKAMLLFTDFSALMIPVATLPALVGYFFRRQMAFAMSFVMALLVSSIINFDIEFFIIYWITGVAVVLSFGSRRRSLMQLKAGAMGGWVALMGILITTLIFSGTIDLHDDLSEHLDPRYSLWISALIGGLASGVLAWICTPVVGRMIGEVSRSKLLDLQDLDQRLLKRLRERGPGTWEHSRAMANLGEAAAHSIGANALLTRVGAYYHDIGKSTNPEFYIENQAGGRNPHDELSPDESAHQIFRHVTEGSRLARKEGIPEDVVEFCYSHHGSSVLEYFWYKNMEEGNPEKLTESDFSYPGHKPSTREGGILVLVDAIEAAARTVDNPDKVAFTGLVQKIIFAKLSQGQLDNSGLSLADLKTVSNTLVDSLVNIHHARIKYPWQKDTNSVTEEIKIEETKAGDSPEDEKQETPVELVSERKTPAPVETAKPIEPAIPTIVNSSDGEKPTSYIHSDTFTGPAPQSDPNKKTS